MDFEEAFTAITKMLEWASEYSLEAEVVLELYRKTVIEPNRDLTDIIYESLCEWDL